jgi:hypothetical protein
LAINATALTGWQRDGPASGVRREEIEEIEEKARGVGIPYFEIGVMTGKPPISSVHPALEKAAEGTKGDFREWKRFLSRIGGKKSTISAVPDDRLFLFQGMTATGRSQMVKSSVNTMDIASRNTVSYPTLSANQV